MVGKLIRIVEDRKYSKIFEYEQLINNIQIEIESKYKDVLFTFTRTSLDTVLQMNDYKRFDYDLVIYVTNLINSVIRNVIKDDLSMFRNVLTIDKDLNIIKNYTQIVIPITYKYKWSRVVKRGEPYYECSSKGHKEYSAIYAKINDKSIEEIYQLDIKGYRGMINNWTEAKGKPPLRNINEEELFEEYVELWKKYFKEHPELLEKIKKEAYGKTITDMFGITSINQARAIACILNREVE